ncbi:MAG: mechanosensitive ion channel family protein [Methanotrichaceae archaeon]
MTTFIVATIFNRLFLGYFRSVSKRLKVDETKYTIIRRICVIFIYLVGIISAIYLIPQLKGVTLSLFAASGILGIVVGLAAQDTMANVISGISIAISQPFRVGDRVTLRGEYGIIEDITLRHTIINTWENKRLIIPNSIINDEMITNWTIGDLPVLWHIDFGIGYDSEIDLARSIILDEVSKHPNVMCEREIDVSLLELGDFAINLRSTFWVPDRGIAWKTGCDITESVKKRFDEEGVEIPFPYRTIVFKNGDLPKLG